MLRPEARIYAVPLVLALSLGLSSRLWLFIPDPNVTKDFSAYYNGALQMRFGLSPYPPVVLDRHVPLAPRNEDTPAGTRYYYPPPLGQLMIPFTYLKFRTAIQIWHYLQFPLIVAMIWLLSLCVVPEKRLVVALSLGVLTLMGEPLASELACTQKTVVTGAIVAGALYAFVKGRDGLGGALTGFGAVYAVTPAVFGVWMLRNRRWAAIGACVATIGGLVLVSICIWGPQDWVDFFTKTAPSLADLPHRTRGNQSLPGFLYIANKGLHLPPSALAIITRACSIGVYGTTLWVIWRRPSGPSRGDRDGILRDWGLLTIASLLTAPCAYPYHYLWLLIAAVPALRDVTAGTDKVSTWWALGALIVAHAKARDGLGQLGRLLQYPQLFGGIALFALLVWRSYRPECCRCPESTASG